MLVDSHCHLHFPPLSDDCEAVVMRACRGGVARMVNIGTKRREMVVAREVAERFENVYCCLGIHPHHVCEEGENVSIAELVEAALPSKVIGIGETGLDYFYDTAPREAQQENFRRHIRAAKEVHVPIVIHSRNAEEDTLRILKEEECSSGVLHCFSSRRFLAEEAIAMGLYISFSGILTFKKSKELREIAADLPMDRLLVETDAPYLAPEPYRGKPCEPIHVINTAEVLANVKGVGFREIAQQTTENFFRLFSKCPPGDLS